MMGLILAAWAWGLYFGILKNSIECKFLSPGEAHIQIDFAFSFEETHRK